MCKLVDSNSYSVKVSQVPSADSKEGYMIRKNLFNNRYCITTEQIPSADPVIGRKVREDVYNQFFK